MSRASATSDALVFGGTPRVHLLPREIEDQRKSRSLRRALLAGLGAALVIVVVAYFGVSLLVGIAGAGQADQQVRAQQLAAQQKKYGAVTEIQSQISSIESLQPLATQNEVLWVELVARIQASLPSSTISITGFTVQIGETDAGLPVDPLVPPHIGQMALTAAGTQDDISAWLINLQGVKGVVDAVPSEIKAADSGSIYVVTMTVYVDADVFAHRFEKSK